MEIFVIDKQIVGSEQVGNQIVSMTMSKMQMELEADQCLRRFSESLKPSEEYHETGVRLCEKVLISISAAVTKTRSMTANPFTVPVAYYSGTINSYNDPSPVPLEFDILVKIGNRQPPFSDVLDFIENTLRNNAFRLQISPRTIKVTGDSIHCSFTNGISVSMVPAASDLTQEEIVEKIKGSNLETSNTTRRYYSSTLMDKQIDFIKQQSQFAHKVCRLAKFWYHSMDTETQAVIGGALMFDLLSISAVLEEEAKCHGREALLRAFTKVVELTEKLDVLSLGFEREFGQYGPWRVKMLPINNSIDDGRLPRLTEPNNPKQNILHGISNEAIEAFKKNGKMMKERLVELVENQKFCEVAGGASGGEEENNAKRKKVVIDFEGLFGAEEIKESNNNNDE